MRSRVLVAAVAVAGLAPAASYADETPVASAVLYEVNESLRFLKGKDGDGKGEHRNQNELDAKEVARRLAHASLLGKEVHPLRPNDVFKEGAFIQADATSKVNLDTLTGPLDGKLFLLVDTDPNRESIDTLVITSDGPIEGDLDLTTAAQGFASLTGRWSVRKPRMAGHYRGLFLIPFRVPNLDGYFYLDLGLDGPGTLCGSPAGICPLEDFEFVLGIPATKLLVLFSSGNGKGDDRDDRRRDR